MSDRTVIVTGGARNIGQAIALRLQADGLRPIVLDQVAPEDKRLTDYHLIDLRDREATRDLVSGLGQKLGIARLVNNVGLVRPALVENTSAEDLETLMELNVLSALTCTQALLPEMKRQGFGRIVTNTSRVVLGKEARTAYSASKGALTAMSRTWALELAPHGITVNCVAPGPIATTAFWENNPPDSERARKIVEGVPVGRMGEPEDVAQGVSFFMDDRSGFITGQTLYICGGITTGLAPV